MSEAMNREIYLLSSRQWSPETIAVTFAKTSRSPQSFREIAAELTEEKSAEFHEKWVVGYGHASVAEHAVLHVAFENISRLATEVLEGNRLASFTEKSTRYQQWPGGGYHLPSEIRATGFETLFRETCDRLFEAYRRSLEPARRVVERGQPRLEGESGARYEGRIRSRYVDACRFLLPSAALANVGVTANARVLENAIRKMLSYSLMEVREIGEALKAAAEKEVPTLLKYAEPAAYLSDTHHALEEAAGSIPSSRSGELVSLIAWDPAAEARVLAASLYPHGSASFADVMGHVRSLSDAERRGLCDRLLGNLGRFDVPLRHLEHATYTFEVVLDQGAYLELKRHRIMTQTPQCLNADLGYAVPRLLVEAGFEGPYREAMEQAAVAYRTLAKWNPAVAAYVVPNGFNRRVLMTLNLREAYHFCELRSGPNAHFSMRRVALRVAEAIQEVHPLLARSMRLPEGADWRTIEAESFAQT